jgi:hypothetical protein
VATPNYADLVAKLKAKQANLGDPRDVPMTPRAQEAFYATQASIARTISTLANAADLDKPAARLAEAETRHAIVIKAQAEIERLIEAQPDWQTIADSRARDREWARQQDLLASRKALVNGVEYMTGCPCVPNALKKILGVVIESDGREVPNWYGCLSDIDARIAELTKKVAAVRARLDAAVTEAEALLGEKVSV